ncbi:MAG: ComEA family DNA-binding protein [Longimicrobiales bacterium]
MTPLTPQETRALAFIAGIVFLSAIAHLLDRPRPIGDDLPGVDVAALEAASRAAMEKPAVRALRPGERIDPNRAPLDELMRLPRMRRAIADRIVATRMKKQFRSISDLDRVPGVGPATLAAWREWIALPAKVETPQRAAPVASARRSGEAAGSRSAAPLDLNRATAAELERLPGIGPALAQRIVVYRDSVGRFERIDQLDRVKGIGPALLARLSTLVTTGT